MKTVALIPIKLNSQRLAHKNILPLAGKPLCWHICNTLLQVPNVDEIYVYCSDDEVMKYVPEGILYKKRNPIYDGNLVKAFEFYKTFIAEVSADIYLVAHTTAPFISKMSIENALDKVLTGTYDSAFAAKKVQTFAWFKEAPINYEINDVPRTQDIEPIYIETSGFYIFKREIFTKYNRRIGLKPFISIVSDIEAIDIDEKSDYDFACMIADLMWKGGDTHYE